MNYLAHFVFNHRICGLLQHPYFAMGVVLPDLWLRYSRQRRLRWKAVRAARPTDALDVQLRDGLLNHVEVDRRFHGLPCFFHWQRRLKTAVDTDGVHPALTDFLAHMAVELALDHHLLRAEPELVDHFYEVVGQSDPEIVAERVGVIGAVETEGLDGVLRGFVRRRFLSRYRTLAGLEEVVRVVLILAKIPPPSVCVLAPLLDSAVAIVEVEAVWAELHGTTRQRV